MELEQLIERHLCPGCMFGPNPRECPKFEVEHVWCKAWVPGTFMTGRGRILLSFPKGFDRLGPIGECKDMGGVVRLWRSIDEFSAFDSRHLWRKNY